MVTAHCVLEMEPRDDAQEQLRSEGHRERYLCQSLIIADLSWQAPFSVCMQRARRPISNTQLGNGDALSEQAWGHRCP